MNAEHSRAMPPTGVAARPAEPSWGRVLTTTIGLWVSRRLVQAGWPRWRRGGWKLAAAVVAVAAVTAAALQLAGVFSGTAARAVRSPSAATASTRAVSARAAAARRAAATRAAARQAEATQAEATQAEAGAWIVGQVSDSAIVGCYPAMCAALQADGMSASQLMPLGPGLAGALSTDVIVVSPPISQRLVDQYAPALIASFGSGGSRVAVRAVARGGTAAYAAAMRSDLAARESAGAELLGNPRLTFSPADVAHIRAGDVDSRLLATLAMLSSLYAFRVAAFGDASPGAQLLFRDVTLTGDGDGKRAIDLPAALALVNAQVRPYLPAHAAIVRLPDGQSALRIEFAEPSPLGLLTTVLTDQIRGN